MASIRTETAIAAPARQVWAALRDVDRADRVFSPVLSASRGDGEDARVVTFANGTVVRERIVDLDDTRMRLAYTVVAGRAEHHHASFQVLDDGAAGCRVLWITDVLPHSLAPQVEPLMTAGAAAMKRALEAAAGG